MGELSVRVATSQQRTRMPEDAGASFRRALEIARRQGATALELRAAMGLSRLSEAEGRRDAVRAILADVLGRFTEGFDTADVREARTFLDG